ncbi:hypothetical protein A4A49_14698 [Nicotiana attenuata]|uniref:Uncharacterized protein n=1 Tax=Nicotiana attenuata TaxID=49451 RepID=A0A314LHP9_NICAT|nr:hypothetical protein A4A49_14698 [Nicotiana attenuata]
MDSSAAEKTRVTLLINSHDFHLLPTAASGNHHQLCTEDCLLTLQRQRRLAKRMKMQKNKSGTPTTVQTKRCRI